jgi:hypothetical protein
MLRECGVHLGDEVKDKISGFKGVVTGITFWLNNCARAVVQPKELTKEGKPKDSETFDWMQLEVTKRANPPPKPRETGGPMNDRAATKRR